jgi:lipopolysaccharide heptosyltransferase I
MPEQRFLVIRLSSLGDIVHTAKAAAMIRGSFPGATMDWLVDRAWLGLFTGCTDFREIITMDRRSWHNQWATIRRIRSARYTCVIDFQGLYKSALLAYLAGAPRRIGFARGFAREPGAARLYTDRVAPPPGHVVDQNCALAMAAGASQTHQWVFPKCTIPPAETAQRVASCNVRQFFAVNPGGGWRSKCWPAERYGTLCRELAGRYGLRAVVNHGPNEQDLADAVVRAAAPLEPVRFCGQIPELVSLLAGAKFVVAGDTGPLHLANALGTPVIGLYGPTDPARTGPYGEEDEVVCNERFHGMDHVRGSAPAPSMLSITVEQVLEGVARRLERLR